MDYVPTPKQTLLLWDVLGRGGSAAQAEVPFKVETKDRDALERAGFLNKLKIGRALWLNVEDKGWAWASDHLDASLVVAPAPKKGAKGPAKPPAPPKVPPKVPTLQNWLTHLNAFLAAKNFSLADLLPQVPPPELPPPKAKAGNGRSKSKAKSPAAATVPELAAIEADVRKAVAALQGEPQRDGVRLSALRTKLAHLDRAVLDNALLTLFASRKLVLMNLDNPRDIEAERDAAISHKGQLLQVLWLPK